jgi:cysteine desulfurase
MSEKRTVYLDNNATTMVDPEVVKAMLPYFTEYYGNASSMHDLAVEPAKAIAEARHKIAE